MRDFSDFVVYADESGDHGLEKIDLDYPVFVLAFVVMRRSDYIETVTPAFQKLKFDFWGHDQIMFHERDLRKKQGLFSILTDFQTNLDFMNNLNSLMEGLPYHACVAVIDKSRLKIKYARPWNPYEIALRFCMEKLLAYLKRHDQENKLVHVIFEGRGRKEDQELELEFRTISTNQSSWGYAASDFGYARFEPVFSRKDTNATGLQLADLVARPCGLKSLRPAQENRAYSIIVQKTLDIGGMKTFP